MTLYRDECFLVTRTRVTTLFSISNTHIHRKKYENFNWTWPACSECFILKLLATERVKMWQKRHEWEKVLMPLSIFSHFLHCISSGNQWQLLKCLWDTSVHHVGSHSMMLFMFTRRNFTCKAIKRNGGILDEEICCEAFQTHVFFYFPSLAPKSSILQLHVYFIVL